MNQSFRKWIAAAAIVAVGAVSMPVDVNAAQDTAIVGGGDVANGAAYVPMRSALNAVGVSVEWEKGAQEKVVLSLGGQTVQVPVDAANGLLTTHAGSFAYANIGGSIQTSLAFYQTIFSNASVSYNAATDGIVLSAIDASQPIGFANLDAYVQEENNGSTGGDYTYYESGLATWYGSGAHGNYTASGEIFNMYDYTAAHKYLPFGTHVRVTDTDTGRSVIVRINDRGPFGAGRVIDLSYQAANDLGIVSKGVAPVTIEVLS